MPPLPDLITLRQKMQHPAIDKLYSFELCFLEKIRFIHTVYFGKWCRSIPTIATNIIDNKSLNSIYVSLITHPISLICLTLNNSYNNNQSALNDYNPT